MKSSKQHLSFFVLLFMVAMSTLISNTVAAQATDTFIITATAAPNGSISPSGAVSVTAGNDQPFTITPDSNYHVADVLVNGVSVGAVTSYTFTNVIADAGIEASFAVDTFDLVISKTGTGAGTVSSADSGIDCGTICSKTYSAGSQVVLTARGDGLSEFTSWGGRLCRHC